VALAILALLVFALLFPRPLRDPVTFTFVGWTNIASVPHAAITVSNQSSKGFLVFAVTAIEDQRKRVIEKNGSAVTLNLAAGTNATFILSVTPGTHRAEYKFVCIDTEPNFLRVLLIKASDLLHLDYDHRFFEKELVVTQ
jgi:hypothetical protein